MTDIKVPIIGESISEVTLLKWAKKDGEYVERDEVIAELESEKATFEVSAEKAGVLKLAAKEGDTLKIGDLLASIDETATKPEASAAPVSNSSNGSPVKEKKEEKKKKVTATEETAQDTASGDGGKKATPVASAIIADKHVDPSTISPSGAGGKILKEDVLAAIANPGKITGSKPLFNREERKEKMSPLRKTIARRLVEAKNTTAMLTTFNEADMSSIMGIRNKYKEKFKEIHGVGLGFMSFFAKACCIALQEWPAVNAQVDGDYLVYHDYCDISIAVSTPRGLTVPVIRNVESLGMAEIEKKVIEVANKAKDNKLSLEELQGGTFTITNGGVFGSLMSTPIINLPQSAILGMHKIQERPVVINGQIAVKPMMYLALSYDHRVIDGRESVGFLVRVKELLENPEQLLIGKDPVKTLLEV
jgi:2-oxoglutarate dehydrogenase E2 component (dihydrolipoamide succinyltransferase)